jgi:hypothetical protein
VVSDPSCPAFLAAKERRQLLTSYAKFAAGVTAPSPRTPPPEQQQPQQTETVHRAQSPESSPPQQQQQQQQQTDAFPEGLDRLTGMKAFIAFSCAIMCLPCPLESTAAILSHLARTTTGVVITQEEVHCLLQDAARMCGFLPAP